MLGKGMSCFWRPNVCFHPLLVHRMVIMPKICLSVTHFLLLIASFSPSTSFHLILSFYLSIFFNFLVSLFFFFFSFLPLLLCFPYFLFWQSKVFSYFSSVTLAPVAWTMNCKPNLSLELLMIVFPLFSDFVFYFRDHPVYWRMIEYFKAFLSFELSL